MSRRVVAAKVTCAHGAYRWGVIRGIILGTNRGFPLEDHPLPSAETHVSGTAGGSDGVPDSLAHKPVDTPGLVVCPVLPLSQGVVAFSPMRSAHSVRFVFHFISFPYFMFSRVPHLLFPPAAAETCPGGRPAETCDRYQWRAYGFREKSLENGGCFLLRAARSRVIIELSPGNAKAEQIGCTGEWK
jgi:hypothetical protein